MAAAVKWATAHGVSLAVKCGGHGGVRWSEGALLLDLSRMRSVYVDPAARVAVVDGGAQARDVDAETALHGLAAPLGVCSVVGVGGLALNGGLSLLSRAVGATADNILEATLVTADGAVVGGSIERWWLQQGGRWRRRAGSCKPFCSILPCPAARGVSRIGSRTVLGAARRGCAAAAPLDVARTLPSRTACLLSCRPAAWLAPTAQRRPCADRSLLALHCAGSAMGVVTKMKLRLHSTADSYCGTLVFADDPAHATYKCAACGSGASAAGLTCGSTTVQGGAAVRETRRQRWPLHQPCCAALPRRCCAGAPCAGCGRRCCQTRPSGSTSRARCTQSTAPSSFAWYALLPCCRPATSLC